MEFCGGKNSRIFCLIPFAHADTPTRPNADTFPSRRYVSPYADTFPPRALKIWATNLSDLC
jgi:hypothetical protein